MTTTGDERNYVPQKLISFEWRKVLQLAKMVESSHKLILVKTSERYKKYWSEVENYPTLTESRFKTGVCCMKGVDKITMNKRHVILIHEWWKWSLVDQDWGGQKAAFSECCGVIFDHGIDITWKSATFLSGFWIETMEDMTEKLPGYKGKISWNWNWSRKNH